ncbi:alkyl sulfatase dimerization domain-containing protein [Streptomyces sp. NPDC050315]|uniref:alkyl sulfatase dimerization domain-containing protein n=1 Tax=Streptomyces sp. NPDC050315 TaxID=3155039 RepID=UPI0034268C87
MDDVGLQEVVDALAVRLGRSVAVDDAGMRLLAASRHVGDEDAARVHSVLRREAAAENIRWVLSLGIASWHGPGRIEANPALGADARVCVPVRRHGALLGYLWLIDYGHREFIVRDIVRSETGWWDGNPTTLHPRPPAVAAAARADAITDKQAVLDHAARLRDAGRVQEALHVIDLLALAPGDDPNVVQARKLKSDLCALRRKDAPSYVSRSCYGTSQ